LFLPLILILLVPQSFADDYTRSYNFKPIHIERDRLLKAVSEIYSYVQNINGVSNETSGYIKLGRDDFSTKINFPISINEHEKFPKISYEAYINIECYKGVVYSVRLRLADESRTIEVTGKSHDHVTGLIKVVQEKFSFYNVTAGGSDFRMIIGAIFILLYSVASVFIMVAFKGKIAAIIYILYLILIQVILYIPPWEYVFPGFIAGVESRTFLDRHAALFTFLGFAIGVIVPVLTLIIRLSKKKSEPKNANSSDTTKREVDWPVKFPKDSSG